MADFCMRQSEFRFKVRADAADQFKEDDKRVIYISLVTIECYVTDQSRISCERVGNNNKVGFYEAVRSASTYADHLELKTMVVA